MKNGGSVIDITDKFLDALLAFFVAELKLGPKQQAVRKSLGFIPP